jgi:hypothetical protein
MAITFDTHILPLYATVVATDPNYENLDGTNEQRLLTTLEVIRSYIETIQSAQEAKVFHSCVSKILSSLPTGIGTGAGFPASQVAAAAITKAVGMFARRSMPATPPETETISPAWILELLSAPLAIEPPPLQLPAPEPHEAAVEPAAVVAAPKPATKRKKKAEALTDPVA